MKPFELHIPTKIYYGKEKSSEFGESLKELGAHALLVIGGGSVKRHGYLDIVTSLLDNYQIKYTTFSGIEPNPLSSTIDKAAAKGKEAGVDFVLALGGGSVMDASKAIAALLYENEDNIWPFVFGEEKAGELTGALPVATVPTTAATASEVTPAAVISNSDIKGKSVIYHSFLKPLSSWLNPEFHTTIPLTATRDGASDILSHVFENYLLGGNDSAVADRYSEGIMDTVIDLLPRITENPEDTNLRGQMLWASTLALIGIQGAGRNPSPFTMHSLEHALSGYNHELAHGRGLATLYPAYFRWLWKNDRVRDRLGLLGEQLFGITEEDQSDAALQFIHEFEDWLKENNLYQRLSDVGIPEDAFGSVADYAIKTYSDEDMLQAAGSLTRDDIIEIFKMTEDQTVDYESKPVL